MTRLTLAHYIQLLEEVGEPFAVLPLQDGASALITQRGGRVLGLFPSSDDENLFWTSSAWESADAFRAFIKRTDGWHWNIGGDRVWIAPEITYNVRDRRDFAGTWDIPKAMDPGNYKLSNYTDSGNGIAISSRFILNGYHHGNLIGHTEIDNTRHLNAGANPIANYPIKGDVHFMGYIDWCEFGLIRPYNSTEMGTPAEIWSLVQLNAGGTLIVPVIGDVSASDYVKPVPDFARAVKNGAIHLPLDGREQFKIGYKALCMTGRMGYFHDLPDGRASLLVRQFYNDPSNLYAEEPPEEPGNSGHSVHVYNDGGAAHNGRPFCEMECSGRTLGRLDKAKWMASNELMSLWAYVGEPEAIRDVCRLLLGSAP